MTKILLIGHIPPPYYSKSKVEAANYRTWQFVRPLLDDGHTISLCFPRGKKPIEERKTTQMGHLLEFHEFTFDQLGWINKLQQVHNAFEPDGVVAVNFDSCLYATRLKTTKPVWMDIYGDYLTIIQAACYRAKSDRGMPTAVAFLHHVLAKGDQFSVCSKAQEHMLVGELAMSGRLNWKTFGYPFVQVVLPGSPQTDDPVQLNSRNRSLLEPAGIAPEDFVVLWCGGYNTWTDVETLFAGLEVAMVQDPRVHFVSVGANTYESVDNTYARFLNLIEKSPYRNRYHMLGWRPWEEVGGYYLESNVGINIDALHYETIYGTRTRLLEMMAAGLPVISSLGSEISFLIKDREAGLGFTIGDWQQLGQKILVLSRDPALSGRMATAAHQLTHGELSFQSTTSYLQDWVKCPSLAPDKIKSNFKEKLANISHKARTFARIAIWQATGLDK